MPAMGLSGSFLESLQLSTDAVEWMRALGTDANDGWVRAEEVWPCECFRPLLWMGLVERCGDEPVFRLTDLGEWALENFIEEVS